MTKQNRPSKARSATLIGVAVLIGTATAIATPQTVGAHHDLNIGWVGTGDNDKVYNFDSTQQNNVQGNRDWPVTIIFTDNAEIDKVKNDLEPEFGAGGGPMNMFLDDNGSWVWDQDSGKDENLCPIQAHYRIYADGDDQMFSQNYGFYVVATTHQDREHLGNCSLPDKFGWSETASDQVRIVAQNQYGAANVQANAVNFFNGIAVSHWSDNNTRWWQNSGKVHRIKVPK